MEERRVLVVGAGVVGLSCAVRLLEAGFRVGVVARDLPLETTSATAAAIWYPYRALPRDRVLAWSTRTYAVLEELARTEPGSGVTMVLGTEVFSTGRAEPWWRSAVPAVERATDLPEGYPDGWAFTTPVAEMPVYLAWLAGRVVELGGTLTRLNLSALPTGAGVVVNCSGIGARLLGDDPTVHPVSGQVLYVEQWGLERWCLDASGPTYVVPRSRDVVVGGTDVEGDWNRTPSPSVSADILQRAARLVPEVAEARVLRHKVGLRPARSTVRLERLGDVVHCYGHGGAGVTLSWGVADDVVALVDQTIV